MTRMQQPRGDVVTRVLLVIVVALAAARPVFPADLRLVDAAKRQDTAAVRALVTQRVDVNIPQPDGATALHWASHHDDLEVARVLLVAGAKVDATNDYGVTPLSLAAGNGSAHMVAVLLNAGAAPDLALPSGETPLMTAARVGSVDAAALLIEKGADVNRQEAVKGQTALIWALFERHLDMTRMLIERGADVRLRSSNGMTPLLFAVRAGDLEAVRLLLARGAGLEEANADGVTPLLMATVRGHADVIEYLLELGADANASGPGFAPLHWAVGTWETSMTHDFPDAEGEWRSLGGLQDRKLDLITALIAHGADVNARVKKSPPRFGINNFAIVKLPGATPFWIAAMSADADVMRLLAGHGANTTMPNDEGVTPLMVAAGMGRVEGDSRLGDVQSVEAVRICLRLGNAVNAVSATGETALHGAAWFGLDEVARLLVEQGGDLTIRDKRQQTPIDAADGAVRFMQVTSHPRTARLLRELAATRTTPAAK